MSTSDHSILGPFSSLSVMFVGRFEAGMRISGANAGSFVVVTSGLTDGGTSGTLFVAFTIGWFTLVLMLSGAIFSLIVDSAETERDDNKEREIRHVS